MGLPRATGGPASHQQASVEEPAGPAASHPLPPPCNELERMALPKKFNGSADRCWWFLRQCNIFSHQREVYWEDGTTCGFLLSLLMGKPLHWALVVCFL
ncbi:uncharacterized protein LOC122141334 [Tachysurus ichikawai]